MLRVTALARIDKMDQTTLMQTKVLMRQLLNLRKKMKENTAKMAQGTGLADLAQSLSAQETEQSASLAALGFKTDTLSLNAFIKEPKTMGHAEASGYHLPHQSGYKAKRPS